MSSKRIEIFKKASNHFKKVSNSLKISPHSHIKSLAAIVALPQCPVGIPEKTCVDYKIRFQAADRQIFFSKNHFLSKKVLVRLQIQ
jgi:hypothetical protein